MEFAELPENILSTGKRYKPSDGRWAIIFPMGSIEW
jgi:hypothetical protein